MQHSCDNIGEKWHALTPQGVPFSPCSTRALKAGVVTTATPMPNGASALGTGRHSGGSTCRSACCLTEATPSTSTRPCSARNPNPAAENNPSQHDQHLAVGHLEHPNSPICCLSMQPGLLRRILGRRARCSCPSGLRAHSYRRDHSHLRRHREGQHNRRRTRTSTGGTGSQNG